jgi:long-chain acyl-CoA synthetase
LAVVARGLPPLNQGVAILPMEEIGDDLGESSAAIPELTSVTATRHDPLEIVFTSGTTAEPRGVVITHGNVLANLDPIEREFQRYRRFERIFHPLRFLDLLPLSHVFGQLLGIFLPQVIGATTMLLDTWNPAEVARTIHDEHVSLLITVPRLIESLREQLERDLAASGDLEDFLRRFEAAAGEHFLKRWWRFRSIRRRFGWHFWAIVSGGSALSAPDEQFWTRLGYGVIQGYGLTETTSLVSLNHPFKLQSGSIGKSLPGLETKLSPEGEILVRGASVASGYWKNGASAPVTDAEGWFHTGDIGERDAAGNLFFRGRLKNVIVTPEGLNVYPQDLEIELRKESAVRDCVVIGLARGGNAEPCAVLILRDKESAPPAGIVDAANQRLAPFQRMRHWFVWPDQDFPRTVTHKPALVPIRAAVEAALGGDDKKASANAPSSPSAGSPLAGLIARISPVALSAGSGGNLQLSSIERVELMAALEDRYQMDLGEADFSTAVNLADLEKLVEDRPAASASFHYPHWPQSWPARFVRALILNLLARPAMLLLGWPRVLGRDNLRGVDTPVLVVANHLTYFDPAYILEGLPARFRRGLAVAMDGERLESMRKPPPGTPALIAVRDRIAYFLVLLIFNVFPLPRRAGFRKSFAFAGNLIDRGWSVLVFPEGERSRTTSMNPFRSGIGLLATRLGVPVLPMRMDGVAERRAAGKHWAPPGEVKVSIGEPIRFEEGVPAEEIARVLEKRVADLAVGPRR